MCGCAHQNTTTIEYVYAFVLACAHKVNLISYLLTLDPTALGVPSLGEALIDPILVPKWSQPLSSTPNLP